MASVIPAGPPGNTHGHLFGALSKEIKQALGRHTEPHHSVTACNINLEHDLHLKAPDQYLRRAYFFFYQLGSNSPKYKVALLFF